MLTFVINDHDSWEAASAAFRGIVKSMKGKKDARLQVTFADKKKREFKVNTERYLVCTRKGCPRPNFGDEE